MNETGNKDSASGRDAGMRKSGYRNEVAMGLAIILTILLVYFGVRFLEGEDLFGSTYELYAEFESAGGLARGSNVTISGVKVGEVAGVRLKSGSRGVDVRLDIQDDVVVPRGSTASVGGISALDNVSVSIDPGPEGNPPLAEGDTLTAARDAGLMGQVDSTLTSAQRTFREAESLVSGTERDLNVILQNMQTASGEAAVLFRDSRGRVEHTLVELQSAAAELNRFAGQMDSVAVNLQHVTGSGGDSLVTAINRMNAMMARLDGVVLSLERGSLSLESFAARVDSGEGTLGRLAADPSLYVRLDSAAMHLNEILSEFRQDPKRYLKHLELVDIF